MSAVASDAVLFSSSAHRAGSAALRGKETSERAESSAFSEHLDSVRDSRGHDSRPETSATPPSPKRDRPSERAATPSSAGHTEAERAKPGRNQPADGDRAGAPAQAADEADPASSTAAKASANDVEAKADGDPANSEDAEKVTVNTVTPADAVETLIDPATGEPVATAPAALAAAAAQALDTADADTTETAKPAKDGKDEKKADTKTDTSATAKPAAPANMIQIVVAPADGAPPSPTDDAQPVKTEGGKAAPIDLHPAVIAQAMPLKTDIDKADTGKDAADTSAEDKAALQQPETADADQPDNGAPSNGKAAATAPIHRQTTTEHNDISAIKSTVDADISTRPAQNGGANPTQPVNVSTPAHQGALTSQIATGNQPPGQAPSLPVPIAGLGIALAAKAMEGKNRFEIRLDPPELGKIEVRLEVHHNGEVTSRMIADRPDTLDLLRRDAAGLERALQDAGLKTSGNGLQFSLRDQGFAGHDQAPERTNTAHIVVNDEIPSVSELPQRNYRPFTGLRGGLDIRV